VEQLYFIFYCWIYYYLQEPEKAFEWWLQIRWGDTIMFYGFPWKVNVSGFGIE
jgi:hypothetical protein